MAMMTLLGKIRSQIKYILRGLTEQKVRVNKTTTRAYYHPWTKTLMKL